MKKKTIFIIVLIMIVTIIAGLLIYKGFSFGVANIEDDIFTETIGTIEIDLYDTTRTADSLVMYTKDYPRNEYGYEVLIEKSTGSVIDTDAIVQIKDGTYVLSGHGEAGLFLKKLDIGDTVEILFNTVTVKRHQKLSNLKKIEIENNRVDELIKDRQAELYDIDIEAIELIDVALDSHMDELNSYFDDLPEGISADSRIINQKMKKIFELIDQKYYMTIENRAVEGRAMWHRPNASAIDETTLGGVIKFAQRLYDMGINTLYIEAFTCGMPLYYSELLQSQKPLMSSYEYGEYGSDYLLALISECHKLGIEVHAWVNVLDAEMPNGEAPDYINDEWISRDLVGNTDGKFLDPSHSGARDFLKQVILEMLSKYDLDGISYDYIRYKESGTYNEEYIDSGFTDNAIKIFSKRYNYHGDLIEDVMNDPDIRARWHEFKQNSINELLCDLAVFIRRINPNIIISASPFGNLNAAKSIYMQDVRTWMEKGYIDVVLPMIYTDSVELLTSIANDFNAYKKQTIQYTGIYALYNKSTLKRNQEIIDALIKSGISGNALFASQNYIIHEDEEKDIVFDVLSTTTHKGRAVLPTADANDIFVAWSAQIVDRCERIYYFNMSDHEKNILTEFFSSENNFMNSVHDVELMLDKLTALRAQTVEFENRSVSNRLCEQIDYLYDVLDAWISRYIIRYGNSGI